MTQKLTVPVDDRTDSFLTARRVRGDLAGEPVEVVINGELMVEVPVTDTYWQQVRAAAAPPKPTVARRPRGLPARLRKRARIVAFGAGTLTGAGGAGWLLGHYGLGVDLVIAVSRIAIAIALLWVLSNVWRKVLRDALREAVRQTWQRALQQRRLTRGGGAR